ncbi:MULTISPECIES: zonular occludens toxin domain-containing protein [Vibrio]|uniref:zonular occludens toxin domain-containing protein n=1 Tax=Vibrio TaxID=662 RepID=UPI0001B93FAA|nr:MULTISPECIES: zonular occludens toxin domain-containing protein [Vibrio]EEX34506.1 zona occludens toxin [Vibrio coralliilyticus ATCC BAA-450]MDE3898546.1 toxin [Vibrio sp. CC007]
MAIRIRTGANGSYKSSYVSYFTVLEALKAGRVVVTNIQGMAPLHIMEERLDIKFPSTSKLIRISSKNERGLELWQYFFCWAPLGALIVIDECQDIYSPKVGFDIKKIRYRPLQEFLPNLPDGYEDFFNSRYVPVNMEELDPCDIDDCGHAEYDQDGRIIYPFTFNEGFMRHRHYNWDIELLSPDWKQIDSGIKACAEECFFHKGRDGFFWTKRKPYIFRHDKSVTTPSIPKGSHPNLTDQKIPLDAFLLYKSTTTGKAQSSGQMNIVFRSPKFIAVCLLFIFCVGYMVYGISDLVDRYSEEDSQPEATEVSSSDSSKANQSGEKGAQSNASLSDGGNRDSSNTGPSNPDARLAVLRNMLGMYDVQSLYYTGHSTKRSDKGFDFFVTLEAVTPLGTYHITDSFLAANDIKYVHYDDCFLKLTKQAVNLNVFCKPVQRETLERLPDSGSPEIKLF